MNKKIAAFGIAIGVGLGLTLGVMRVNAGVEEEKGLVIGHAIEISTYITKGLSPETIEEMKNRTEQGFPVAIIEQDTNELWICIYRNNAPASGLEPGNQKMQEFMGMEVVAQGIKYTENGVNLMRFGNISEY